MQETKKQETANKKEEMGIVLSNKMQKTIVVKIDRRKKHSKYGKFITKSKKVKAHDELNVAQIGNFIRESSSDSVSIIQEIFYLFFQ